MTAPARTRIQQETTGPSRGFLASEPSPEVCLLISGNYQNLSARPGEGLVLADVPELLAPSIERVRP